MIPFAETLEQARALASAGIVTASEAEVRGHTADALTVDGGVVWHHDTAAGLCWPDELPPKQPAPPWRGGLPCEARE